MKVQLVRRTVRSASIVDSDYTISCGMIRGRMGVARAGVQGSVDLTTFIFHVSRGCIAGDVVGIGGSTAMGTLEAREVARRGDAHGVGG